jgi:carbamoyl-phosphate synthase large subunit
MDDNFISLATRILLGKQEPIHKPLPLPYVAVKAPQFSYNKLRGADPVQTVEMNSTGEVVGFGKNPSSAYLQAIQATGVAYPTRKTAYISLGGSVSKLRFLKSATLLSKNGYTLYASIGTGMFLRENGIPAQTIYKISEHEHPTVVDLMKEKRIDFAVVTLEHLSEAKKDIIARSYSDRYIMRRAAVDFGIPIFTNNETADYFVQAILTQTPQTVSVSSWNSYRMSGTATKKLGTVSGKGVV